MIKSPSDAELFLDIRKPGLGGLNTIDDPSEVADQESPDMLNTLFDTGQAAPRGGSELWAAKPVGEDQDPLQIMKAVTSDGLEYVVAVYGNNFYLRDVDKSRWVKINDTYTPETTDQIYGYVSWNVNRGDDRLYFCNGVDNFARWDINLDHLASDHTVSDATVTVNDATRFPSSGTLVITNGTTTVYKGYSSKSGNIFTLTSNLGVNIEAGSSVSVMIVEKSAIEKGKVVTRWQRRLITANRYGGETNFYYSKTDDPEYFTPGLNVVDAGFFQLADGDGAIQMLVDFGTFLLVGKQNDLITFQFQINSTLNAKLEQVQPLISGRSVGPLTYNSLIKVQNSLYYPTLSNGIIMLDPRTTGSNATTTFKILSQKINTLVNSIGFSKCRIGYADNKLFFPCATGSANNLVLVFDIIRQAWTKFDSWLIQDMFTLGDDIHFMSRTNGKIYKGLVGKNDDNSPFISYYVGRRHNFGKPSIPKTIDAIYLEGYMTSASDFFVEVRFNEMGKLATRTYQINVDTPGLYFVPSPLNPLGMFPAELSPMGEIPESQIGVIGSFHCYLSVPNSKAFFNLQIKIYSKSANSLWYVTGYSANPTLEKVVPTLMRVSPID